MLLSTKILRKKSYPELISKLIQDVQVYAPVEKKQLVQYSRIQSPEEIADEYIIPRLSPKSLVFPRVEYLFSYTKTKDDLTIQSVDTAKFPERVILGVRPCDAKGLEVLHVIFKDEPKDEIFEARVEKTTIIGLSCSKCDAYCFCPDGPGNISGSDILLTKIDGDDFLVEIVTEKGMKLINRYADLFEEQQGQVNKEAFLAKMSFNIDQKQLSQQMSQIFDSEIFEEQALRCLACIAK